MKSEGLVHLSVAIALIGALPSLSSTALILVLILVVVLTISFIIIHFDNLLPYQWWKSLGKKLAGIRVVYVSLALGLAGTATSLLDNQWVNLGLIFLAAAVAVLVIGMTVNVGIVTIDSLTFVSQKCKRDFSKVTIIGLSIITLICSILIIVGVFLPWLYSNNINLAISGWNLPNYIDYGLLAFKKPQLSLTGGILMLIFSLLANAAILSKRFNKLRAKLHALYAGTFLSAFMAFLFSLWFIITRDGLDGSYTIGYGLVSSLVFAFLGILSGALAYAMSLPKRLEPIEEYGLTILYYL